MPGFVIPHNAENWPHLSYDSREGYFCRACFDGPKSCPLCRAAEDRDIDQRSQEEAMPESDLYDPEDTWFVEVAI